MASALLPTHDGLWSSRRLGLAAPLSGPVPAAHWAALVGLGAAAAALSTWVKSGLGVPGHNILYVIFPMALGLALVPRHGSATVMGASGLAWGGLFGLVGPHGMGSGALTGLAMLGLLLDLALLGARSGRGVYVRLAAAGLAANLAAMAVRGGVKLAAGDGKLWEVWLPQAAVSYPLCGLAAGLVSAAVWFRLKAGSERT